MPPFRTSKAAVALQKHGLFDAKDTKRGSRALSHDALVRACFFLYNRLVLGEACAAQMTFKDETTVGRGATDAAAAHA